MQAKLEKLFKVSEYGSNVRTEVVSGVATFLTMCYIVVINPAVLSAAGMDRAAVFTATCLTAGLGSILMGLMANYPIGLAPGMGINAYFAYGVVLGMGVSWEVALGAVFFSGVLFTLFSLLNVREALINAMPDCLKYSIGAGVGLFLGLIGMQNAGIVVASPSTLVTLGDIRSPGVIYAVLGFLLIVALDARRIKGAVIISILSVSCVSILLGHAEFKGLVAVPPSLLPTFLRMDLAGALDGAMLSVIFVFFFVHLFDSSGTMVAVFLRAGLLREGKLPRLKAALLADSVTTVAGAALGTSPGVAYVESVAGVTVGGKTGLTAVTVGLLFFCCLIFSPLAASVPAFATAPALIYVAGLMCRSFTEINWDDVTEAAPAFVTAVAMPFTFSIANGIAFGFVTYALVKTLAGRHKEVSWLVFAVAAVWILKFALIDAKV